MHNVADAAATRALRGMMKLHIAFRTNSLLQKLSEEILSVIRAQMFHKAAAHSLLPRPKKVPLKETARIEIVSLQCGY